MNTSYPVLEKLLDNKYRLIHHALYAGFIFFFWFLWTVNAREPADSIFRTILYSCTYIGIAYFNIYVLFRYCLLKGRIITYLLLSLLTFFTSYLVQNFIYFKSWEQFRKDFTFSVPLVVDMMINTITYCMFIGIGLSAKMIKMWLHSENRISSLEQENLKARLSSLKSQISPHFLFNTFNNLYVLTKTNPKIASEMILGFADLMRYQLNESDKEKVRIENEINYIRNFLALEKLRKDKLDIKISYTKNSIKGVQIEPLLFVTLIENAVKHGSQQMENPFIHIYMERKDTLFTFEVVNSKPEISRLGKEESPGTGIANLKKRLNLSYPLKHILELTDQKNVFTAKLQLELI